MDEDVTTARSVGGGESLRARALNWLLFRGNRIAIAAGVVVAVFALFVVAIRTGAVAVGPSSSASTAFGSGLVSGTLTLVTVALSINQLILSRVFGSPNELRDKLDGTRDLRRLVQDHADAPNAPNDPAAFLTMVANTLTDRARQFESAVADGVDAAAVSAVADVAAYGQSIDDEVAGGSAIVDVLDVIIGTEYAENMTAIEAVRNECGDAVSEAATEELDAVDDLLEAIAIARQFFKTIALQQDFARLSRILAYSGLLALLASVLLTLVYRSSAVTLPVEWLPIVVPLGIAVVVTPLAVFIAYILRAATIARRTVSVGPFVPPVEQ